MFPCPPESDLSSFLTGTQTEPLAHHVRDCAACQTRLDAMSDDGELRQWASRARGAAEPALQQVLAAWRDAPPKIANGDTAEISATERVAASRLEPGTRIDSYILERELGRGGMGVVYRAFDEVLRRPVALKVVRADGIDDRARSRCLREAQAAAALRHEAIVQVYAVGETPHGAPYLVMEFIDGASLAERVRRGALTPIAAVAAVVQAADGLAAAHAAGLIHRDIKPSNILIERSGTRVKVTDFGLARAELPGSTLTGEGFLAGTPAYMSPEQAAGSDRLDARTDVYSLGVTLYELLTGEAPFRGAAHLVLEQVRREEPRPPRRFSDAIPRDLETICLKAMAKEPAKRYASAAEFAADLRHWQRGEPILARPIGPVGRTARWCRRNPRVTALLATVAAVFALGLAGTSWQAWRADRKSKESAEHAREAREELQRARETVNRFLTEVSEDPDLKGRNLEPLRRRLVEMARDDYEAFVAKEPDDPELRLELGRAHRRLGLIAALLDGPPRGIPHHERARSVFERRMSEQPDDAAARFEFAQNNAELARCYHYAGRYDDALAAGRASQQTLEALTRAEPDNADYALRLLKTLCDLGRSSHIGKRLDDAGQFYNQGLAAYERWSASHAAEPAMKSIVAQLLSNQGSLYRHQNQPSLAKAKHEQAVAVAREAMEAKPRDAELRERYGVALLERGNTAGSAGDHDAAQKSWELARDVDEELLRAHPQNSRYLEAIGAVCNNLGISYLRQNKLADSLRNYRRALDANEQLLEDSPEAPPYWFNFATSIYWLGAVERASGDPGKAHEAYTRGLTRWAAAFPPGGRAALLPDLFGQIYCARAIAALHLGKHAMAIADYDRAAALLPAENQRLVTQGRLLAEGFALLAATDHYAAALKADAAIQAPADNHWLELAARLYAACVPLAKSNDRLANDYANRAVAALKQLQAASGLHQALVAELQSAAVWQPVRSRADFRAILATSSP